MTYEDVIFDGYSFADKGVARYFDILADFRIFLDFYKRTDLGVVADRAAVEIDESGYLHVLAKTDVGSYGYEFRMFHLRTIPNLSMSS